MKRFVTQAAVLIVMLLPALCPAEGKRIHEGSELGSVQNVAPADPFLSQGARFLRQSNVPGRDAVHCRYSPEGDRVLFVLTDGFQAKLRIAGRQGAKSFQDVELDDFLPLRATFLSDSQVVVQGRKASVSEKYRLWKVSIGDNQRVPLTELSEDARDPARTNAPLSIAGRVFPAGSILYVAKPLAEEAGNLFILDPSSPLSKAQLTHLAAKNHDGATQPRLADGKLYFLYDPDKTGANDLFVTDPAHPDVVPVRLTSFSDEPRSRRSVDSFTTMPDGKIVIGLEELDAEYQHEGSSLWVFSPATRRMVQLLSAKGKSANMPEGDGKGGVCFSGAVGVRFARQFHLYEMPVELEDKAPGEAVEK